MHVQLEKSGLELTSLIRDEKPWPERLTVTETVELQGLVKEPSLGLNGRFHSCPRRPAGRIPNGKGTQGAQSAQGAWCAQGAGRCLWAEPSCGGVRALRAGPRRSAPVPVPVPVPAPGRVGPAPQLHPLPPPPACSRLLKSQPARGGGAEPARRTRQPARP